MARAEIDRQTLAFTGTEPTMTAVDSADTGDGDGFDNDGQTFLVFANIDVADDLTLTMVTGATVDGLAVADETLIVGESATVMTIVGPFPVDTWNQGSGTFAGMVELDYTGTAAAITDSTMAAIH